MTGKILNDLCSEHYQLRTGYSISRAMEDNIQIGVRKLMSPEVELCVHAWGLDDALGVRQHAVEI